MADIGDSTWNETDASNTTAAPDGAPEGMAPGGVNDTIRNTRGAVKRFWSWQSTKTTGGTTAAYTLSYTVAPGALVDGMTHLVQFNAANADAATLNVNSLGAKPLQYYSYGAWRAIPVALFGANFITRVAYNSSAGTYRMIDVPDRTGEVSDFAGATAPAGALLCYGQAISRTAYVGLFTALSTDHGVGDGSTTFNLPDLRGRVVAGQDDMGGSSANRLTSPINGDTFGAAGGTEGHTHSISITSAGAGGGSAPISFGTDFTGVSFEHQHAVIGTTASDSSMQPTIILNKIIRI